MKNFINNQLFPFLIVSGIMVVLGMVGYFVIQGVKTELAEPVELNVQGVNIANEYHATNTRAITGTLYKASQTRHLIQSASSQGTAVTLGSVVIASTTVHTMSIYNATSSEAVINGDGTLITTFPESAPQGTYSFDVSLDKGLVLDLASGFGGDYTLTYR